MPGDLHDLHVGSIRRVAGDAQPRRRQRLLVLAVELIAMAMALADFRCAVCLFGLAASFKMAVPGAQAHRSAQLFHAAQFAQLVDDAVRRRRIELAGVGIFQAAHVARVLDARRLHAQTDAEVRNLVLARKADAVQHAGNAALAKSSGDENAVKAFQLRLIAAVVLVLRLQTLGFNPLQIQFQVVVQRGVYQRFFQGLIAVLVLHVLAHHADQHFVLRVVGPVDKALPGRHVAVFCLYSQILEHQFVHALVGKGQGTFVDARHVPCGNHGALFHVAE